MTYILYKLVPRPDGRTDKKPVDWRTLRVFEKDSGWLSDPTVWIDAQTASNLAKACGPGYGVGWVVQPGYWFLDIDHAYDPTTGWSPLATELWHRFPDAYHEISQSGAGLHIVGRGETPPHRAQRDDLGLGLYTQKRFCALTGIGAFGSMDADYTASIAALAAELFPPSGAAGAPPAEWTDEPRFDWSGHTDDAELIRHALAATSAAAAFGGGVSFRDLWEGNEDALGRKWPDAGPQGRAYDASAADASLAQHLAYWTGSDCERMETLMRESALARPKWEREDYLRRTILRAAGQQTRVHQQTAPTAPTVTGDPTTLPAASGTAGPVRPSDGLVAASDYPAYFQGCVYIEDRYVAAAPDGALLTPQQFRASSRYGGARFMLDKSKVTRSAWEAFTESGVWTPPCAASLCFRPELPSRALIRDNDRLLYNSYVPIETAATPGDVTPFLDLMRRHFPVERDRAILIAYLASLTQNPGTKFQWCPLIQGCEGNGKTVYIEIAIQAVGERYSHTPNATDLANKFNAWLERKIFIGVEEIAVRERLDLLDTMKVYIGNRRMEVQGKGADQIMGDNRANFLLLTNHKDAVPKTKNDRRYCPLFTAQQQEEDIRRDGMGGDYFPSFYAWLRSGGFAHITHYLKNYAIPAELDPAGACHRAPLTSSTAEAIEASLGPVEQAVQEAVESGETGFRGGWVSSYWLGLLLDARRLRGKAPLNKWTDIMRGMGYVPHPALPSGRTNNAVAPDGRKSKLWVRAGSIPALNLTTPNAAASAYTAANEVGAEMAKTVFGGG